MHCKCSHLFQNSIINYLITKICFFQQRIQKESHDNPLMKNLRRGQDHQSKDTDDNKDHKDAAKAKKKKEKEKEKKVIKVQCKTHHILFFFHFVLFIGLI